MEASRGRQGEPLWSREAVGRHLLLACRVGNPVAEEWRNWMPMTLSTKTTLCLHGPVWPEEKAFSLSQLIKSVLKGKSLTATWAKVHLKRPNSDIIYAVGSMTYCPSDCQGVCVFHKTNWLYTHCTRFPRRVSWETGTLLGGPSSPSGPQGAWCRKGQTQYIFPSSLTSFSSSLFISLSSALPKCLKKGCPNRTLNRRYYYLLIGRVYLLNHKSTILSVRETNKSFWN